VALFTPERKPSLFMSDKGIFLVTGAASGIGLSCASQLAERGTKLLLADISTENLIKAVNGISSTNASIEFVAGDISKQSDLAEICHILDKNGGLSGCIHAAGLGGSMAPADRVLAVNLGGTARLLPALLPYAHKGSAVLCVASQAGHFWRPGVTDEIRQLLLGRALDNDLSDSLAEALGAKSLDSATAYALSKYGVQELVVEQASEFGQKGVRLISLSPGIVQTPMASSEIEVHQDAMQAIIDQTPVDSRPGKPKEIARVAIFLCSKDASFVSGVDILVDGGSTNQILRR